MSDTEKKRDSGNGEVVLSVRHLSKCFAIYNRPKDRLKQMLLGRTGKKYYREFWALRDVSFVIRRGECVGIIGQNGAGKSTLLQMVVGTLRPTGGSVETRGRIAALLELGSGFNPEFTGRENVYLNASILGLTKEETDARYEDIVKFADIGEFIDQPVKTYSSGMMVRLAFAVNVCVDPDVLIVDEALAVGDVRFQMKCFARMKKFLEDGSRTVIFVSHEMGTIRQFCTHVIWLRDSRVFKEGSALELVEDYLAYMVRGIPAAFGDAAADSAKADDFSDVGLVPISANALTNGDGGARITHVGLFDSAGRLVQILGRSQRVTLRFRFVAEEPILRPQIAFHVVNRKSVDILGSSNEVLERSFPAMKAGDVAVAEFSFTFPEIANDEYLILVAVNDDREVRVRLHNVVDAYTFRFASDTVFQRQGVLVKLPDCAVSLDSSGQSPRREPHENER